MKDATTDLRFKITRDMRAALIGASVQNAVPIGIVAAAMIDTTLLLAANGQEQVNDLIKSYAKAHPELNPKAARPKRRKAKSAV